MPSSVTHTYFACYVYQNINNKSKQKIKNKLESGEIDGMQYIDGKNENGEDEILDAELFKASSIDSDSKDKNIYRPFNNA